MDKKLDIWELLKSIETEEKICCRCLCLSLVTESKDGAHLGKLINFYDLPYDTRNHVLSRM